MVCRNKERAEAAKDEIVELSKNQVGELLHVVFETHKMRFNGKALNRNIIANLQ